MNFIKVYREIKKFYIYKFGVLLFQFFTCETFSKFEKSNHLIIQINFFQKRLKNDKNCLYNPLEIDIYCILNFKLQFWYV